MRLKDFENENISFNEILWNWSLVLYAYYFFSLIGNFEFLSKRNFKAKVILFLSIYIELIFDNIHLHFCC